MDTDIKRKYFFGGALAVVILGALWVHRPINPTSYAAALVSIKDDDRNIALIKIQKLSQTQQAALVPALLPYLSDPDWRVRRFALYALRKLHADNTQIPPALVNALKDPQVDVRKEADVALSEQGEKVIPLLVNALDQPDSMLANSARHILMKMGAVAVPALRSALQNKSAVIRRESAGLIGAVNPKPLEAKPDLLVALKDTNLGVRINAAVAINRIDTNDTTTLPVHIEALKQKTIEFPLEPTIHVLADLGPKAKPAIAALKDVFKKSNDSVRRKDALRPSIAAALNTIDPRRDIVADLLWDLKQPDAVLRYRAAFTLSEMTTPDVGAQSGLVQALDDKDVFVSARALYALTKIGFNQSERFKKVLPAKAIRVLGCVNETQMEGLSDAVGTALMKMGPGIASNELMPFINGKDATLKTVGARLLDQIQKPALQKPAAPDEDASALQDVTEPHVQ